MGKKLIFAILLAGIVCVASQVAEAGPLVGYWPFDGNLNDQAGTANGTFSGGQAGYQKGQVGQAVSFDGVDDFVNIPSPVNPSIYTISVWVKPARTTAAGIVTRTDASGPNTSWSHQLRINTAGQFHHYLWVGAERNLAGTTKIVPDTWYHVVIKAENNGPMRLYVNGQEEGASIGTAGTLWATGDRIHVGSNSGHGMGWFQGLVDELRIYNRELTPVQISDLSKGTAPSFLKAEKPTPADGTIGAAVPLLQWSKGDTAMFHNIYLGASPDLTDTDLKAARQSMTLYYHVPGLEPGTLYYWRVDEVEMDGVTIHTGDVWSFMSQALTAYYPGPADGTNTVSTTPTLTWMAGQGTVKHHVYFGDSLDAVAQGAAATDKGPLAAAETTFKPEALESLTTYYWRVDELLLGDAVKAGPVWKFTTALTVDDFEDYTDDEGGRIYETWVDGWVNGTGSTVGNVQAPFAEQTIVHEGKQSMPLDYNNINSPFYSEAEQEFATAQDWASDGVDALVLYVRGAAGNTPAQLYVALEDTAKHVGVVAHPDPKIVVATQWTEWKVPLTSFTGVNPAKIKKLYLGVGDRTTPVADGGGRLYIDDIRLVKP